MKLIVSHANLAQVKKLESWIERSIASLNPFLRIDEAVVSIEHRPECSPAYQASAHLKVPGPDLRAIGVDHTVRTAFSRVFEQLRRRATERAARRSKRPDGQCFLQPFQHAHFSRA